MAIDIAELFGYNCTNSHDYGMSEVLSDENKLQKTMGITD